MKAISTAAVAALHGQQAANIVYGTPVFHVDDDEEIPPAERMMSQAWDTLTPREKQLSSRTVGVFLGMVHRMDTQIGRVVEHLRRSGDLDNMTSLSMSDHGAKGLLTEALPLIIGVMLAHV